jgi:hypothetical protein
MKAFLWGLVIGSALTNAAWIFRAKIKAWIAKKTPLAEANDAMNPKP